MAFQNAKHRLYPSLTKLLPLTTLLLSGCGILTDIESGLAYAALSVCSDTFISQQDPSESADYFTGPKVDPLPLIWKIEVNADSQTTHASDYIFGDLYAADAVFRPGFGCTLMYDKSIEELDNQTPDTLYKLTLPENIRWPHGSAPIELQAQHNSVDHQAIADAITVAFEETPDRQNQTTSIIVIYQGELIAERYRDGFNKATPVIGWSMSKSITSTLFGILSDRNILELDTSSLFAEWMGTEKEIITLNNLLHMTHGLEYEETSSGPRGSAALMFYLNPSHSQFMLDLPLVEKPGTLYNYSSGATALLSNVIQDTVGGSLGDAYEFYQTQLFHRIDIASAIFEHDNSGYFVGGASAFMTPRDWARFGQLYLQEGVWNDDVILSPEWMDYALTPSPANDTFGAHVFLNTDQKRWISLPADSITFLGTNEQVIFIIPSKELVVVRTGYTRGGEETSQKERLAASIVQALP